MIRSRVIMTRAIQNRIRTIRQIIPTVIIQTRTTITGTETAHPIQTVGKTVIRAPAVAKTEAVLTVWEMGIITEQAPAAETAAAEGLPERTLTPTATVPAMATATQTAQAMASFPYQTAACWTISNITSEHLMKWDRMARSR